jgi:hypothetical protein
MHICLSFAGHELVSTDIGVRYAAVADLARWVGSSLSQRSLCCIAQSSAQFMGSHDRTSRDEVRAHNGGNEQREISRRYGKWRTAVGGNPALGGALHSAGKEGLELFGYFDEEEAGGALSSRGDRAGSTSRRFPYAPSGAEAEAEAGAGAGAGFVCADPTADSERWCAANKNKHQS